MYHTTFSEMKVLGPGPFREQGIRRGIGGAGDRCRDRGEKGTISRFSFDEERSVCRVMQIARGPRGWGGFVQPAL